MTTETTTAEATTVPESFETETCSRCGGSGNYSYCQMYGTRCFKCGGKGKHLTARGVVARAFYDASRTVKGEDIKPGMLVYRKPGPMNKGQFERVTSVGFGGSKYLDKESGEMVAYWDINTTEGGFCGFLDSDYIVGQTAEEKAAKLRAAFEYQANLTKAGKPRKRSK